MNFTIETAINIVKLFITLGAEEFYTKYFIHGNRFTEQYRVNKKAFSNTINFAKRAEKDYKKGLLTDEELDIETTKLLAFTFMKDIEKATIEKQKPIRYVADLIVGQVVPMFEMIVEIRVTNDLEYETIEEIETEIYHKIAQVLCFYIKDEEDEEG